MNVGRKLVNDLKNLLGALETWIEMHEMAFDHSEIKEEVKDIWMDYHDEMMES